MAGVLINVSAPHVITFTMYLSRYSDWLRAGWSGDRIPVATRFSAPVQTGHGAHLASCTMRTGSFPGVKSGRGVMLKRHNLPVPRSWKSRAIPLFSLYLTFIVQINGNSLSHKLHASNI